MYENKDDLYLILQPYGSVLYDLNKRKFIIMNNTATKIIEDLISGMNAQSIVQDIVRDGEKVGYDEVEKDVLGVINTLNMFEITTNRIKGARTLGSKDNLSIIAAELELTQECSFACQYCLVYGSPSGKSGLSKSKWLKIVKTLLNKNLMEITLTGGDPLNSDSFWPIMELLQDTEVGISIYTPGIKVDIEFIKKLKELHNFKNISLQISLDSVDEKINDRYRGIGAYKSAINAIKLLNQNSIPVTIATLIFPDTINSLEPIFIFGQKYSAKVKVGLVDFIGRATQIKKERIILNEEQKQRLNLEYAKMQHKYGSSFNDIIELKQLNESELENFEYMSNLEYKKCPTSYGIIDINFDGLIKPCSLPKEYFEKLDKDFMINPKDISTEISNIGKSNFYNKISKISVKQDSSINKWGGCTLYEYYLGLKQ
ncbi:MAG: radical SAM protein [Caldisphaera sp.]